MASLTEGTASVAGHAGRSWTSVVVLQTILLLLRPTPKPAVGYVVLQSQFGVGLREAAQNLRICPTTLKRACRRHGITRWPRRQTWTSEGVQLCEAPSEPLTLDMEPASPVTAPKGQPGMQAMQVQLGMSPAPSMPVLSRQATGKAASVCRVWLYQMPCLRLTFRLSRIRTLQCIVSY